MIPDFNELRPTKIISDEEQRMLDHNAALADLMEKMNMSPETGETVNPSIIDIREDLIEVDPGFAKLAPDPDQIVEAVRLRQEAEEQAVADAINQLANDIYTNNVGVGWYKDFEGLEDKPFYPLILLGRLMLQVTELAEAAEGIRKNLMDDKLPHRTMEEVEMADAVIRILDHCGSRGLDIGGAIMEKRRFNAVRPDHKLEHRAGVNGKKC